MTVPGRRKLTVADLKPKAVAPPPQELPEAKPEAPKAKKKRNMTPARRQAVARKRKRRRLRTVGQIGLPEITAQIAKWAVRYPAVFVRPVPLARGTRQVILADDAEAPPALVAAALTYWTQRSGYIKAILSGSVRHDLQGNPAGEVTKEDRAAIRSLLKQTRKQPAGTAEQSASA